MHTSPKTVSNRVKIKRESQTSEEDEGVVCFLFASKADSSSGWGAITVSKVFRASDTLSDNIGLLLGKKKEDPRDEREKNR
jgi:hypothetical protein